VTRLALLAPAIVEAIAAGRVPAALNLQRLMERRVSLPLDWQQQAQLFELE